MGQGVQERNVVTQMAEMLRSGRLGVSSGKLDGGGLLAVGVGGGVVVAVVVVVVVVTVVVIVSIGGTARLACRQNQVIR